MPVSKLLFLAIIDPELLAVVLNGSYVGVWPKQDVLKLGLFLVDFFYGLRVFADHVMDEMGFL